MADWDEIAAGLRSTALRTDLHVLQIAGGQLERADGHIVVRTPDSPLFWHGNFLLYPAPPGPADLVRWPQAFEHAFGADPRVIHSTFAWDGIDGAAGNAALFASEGYTVDRLVTLTARGIEPPARGLPAGYKVIELDPAHDAMWADLVEITMSLSDWSDDQAVLREHAEREVETWREMARQPNVAWFGLRFDPANSADASVDDASNRARIVGMGGMVVADGLARYQSIAVLDGHRGRGGASWLLHAAGMRGLEFGAQTLVLVADDGSDALRLYESLGFVATERSLRLVNPRRAADTARGAS